MFLVELGNERDPLARFVAQRFARWVASARRSARPAPPRLPQETLLALARRRLGLIRYTAPGTAEPRPADPRR